MELGIYHEFPVLPGRSQAECFAAGFDIVDAAEEYGLDVMWLAELHFAKRRALAASPLILGTAIAARTERIKIGTSCAGASAGESAANRRGSSDLGPRLQGPADLRRRA